MQALVDGVLQRMHNNDSFSMRLGKYEPTEEDKEKYEDYGEMIDAQYRLVFTSSNESYDDEVNIMVFKHIDVEFKFKSKRCSDCSFTATKILKKPVCFTSTDDDNAHQLIEQCLSSVTNCEECCIPSFTSLCDDCMNDQYNRGMRTCSICNKRKLTATQKKTKCNQQRVCNDCIKRTRGKCPYCRSKDECL